MSSRRRLLAIIVLLLGLIALILLLSRCTRENSAAPRTAQPAEPSPKPTDAAVSSPAPVPAVPAERLSPVTLQVPREVPAGAPFAVAWTGPDNPGDYVAIAAPASPAVAYNNYRDTRQGAELRLLAPMEPGPWEVRYVALQSRTVLGRATVLVTPVAATLQAADDVVLGSPVTIEWTGPNNLGDFITIVAAPAPDSQIGHSADTAKGSPATITAPVNGAAAEIRYVAGQDRRILGRRPLRLIMPDTSLTAADEVVAGARFAVEWTGPNHAGDYVTIVPAGTPDGQYRNYQDTAKGSPVHLVAPIEPGVAELRYMTAGHARVLARRTIRVVAPTVTLEAPDEVVVGAAVEIRWTGPKNAGDYVTIVPQATPDGQYRNYTDTSKGSPLTVVAPMQPGAAEIRYMSGQGAKVLGRRLLNLRPAEVTLRAPATVTPGSTLAVEWTGPNNRNDYLTFVPKNAKDSVVLRTQLTARATPARFIAPTEPGDYEVRYVSGQGNSVLGRTTVEVR